jgi:hypothetical protein
MMLYGYNDEKIVAVNPAYLERCASNDARIRFEINTKAVEQNYE